MGLSSLVGGQRAGRRIAQVVFSLLDLVRDCDDILGIKCVAGNLSQKCLYV